MKRLLLQPRAILLGFTVFYFSWAATMWMRGPWWDYHRELFVAIVLLLSGLGLAINRAWSNLLAAIVSGQLTLAFFAEFWMLSMDAEVTTFGIQHLKLWLWTISSNGLTPILWLNLSAVILSYAVFSILRGPTSNP